MTGSVAVMDRCLLLRETKLTHPANSERGPAKKAQDPFHPTAVIHPLTSI